MSVQLPPSSLPQQVPSLQALCAIQVNEQLDAELDRRAKTEGPVIDGTSSIWLTATRVLEVLRSVKREDPSLTKRLPHTLLELVANPYLLVEYQKSALAYLEKESKASADAFVHPEAERVWQVLCKQDGYDFKPGDPAMTWEQLYFKERIAKTLVWAQGHFEEINPRDWCLFYSNRSRVKVLEFVTNPWMKGEKLSEILALFNGVTSLRVNKCDMQEEDWVEALSKLKKIEHLDLGIHIGIGNKALDALAKNAAGLRSLDISSISYLVELQAIVRLVKKAPVLNSLVLGEQKHLKDTNQIAQVLNAAPQLRKLELQSFESLSMKDINDLLKAFPNIQTLTLRDCSNLKREELDSFTGHSHLRRFEIIDCRNLARNDLALFFLERCPSLERFICAKA